jgi:hypothetical protein
VLALGYSFLASPRDLPYCRKYFSSDRLHAYSIFCHCSPPRASTKICRISQIILLSGSKVYPELVVRGDKGEKH